MLPLQWLIMLVSFYAVRDAFLCTTRVWLFDGRDRLCPHCHVWMLITQCIIIITMAIIFQQLVVHGVTERQIAIKRLKLF